MGLRRWCAQFAPHDRSIRLLLPFVCCLVNRARCLHIYYVVFSVCSPLESGPFSSYSKDPCLEFTAFASSHFLPFWVGFRLLALNVSAVTTSHQLSPCCLRRCLVRYVLRRGGIPDQCMRVVRSSSLRRNSGTLLLRAGGRGRRLRKQHDVPRLSRYVYAWFESKIAEAKCSFSKTTKALTIYFISLAGGQDREGNFSVLSH